MNASFSKLIKIGKANKLEKIYNSCKFVSAGGRSSLEGWLRSDPLHCWRKQERVAVPGLPDEAPTHDPAQGLHAPTQCASRHQTQHRILQATDRFGVATLRKWNRLDGVQRGRRHANSGRLRGRLPEDGVVPEELSQRLSRQKLLVITSFGHYLNLMMAFSTWVNGVRAQFLSASFMCLRSNLLTMGSALIPNLLINLIAGIDLCTFFLRRLRSLSEKLQPSIEPLSSIGIFAQISWLSISIVD